MVGTAKFDRLEGLLDEVMTCDASLSFTASLTSGQYVPRDMLAGYHWAYIDLDSLDVVPDRSRSANGFGMRSPWLFHFLLAWGWPNPNG